MDSPNNPDNQANSEEGAQSSLVSSGGMSRGAFLRKGAAGAGLAAVLGLGGYGSYSVLADDSEASASRERGRRAAAAVPAGFASRTANVGDIRMHYVRGGSGDPVVLVHGWGQTWYEWRKIMPALAERYDVIALDLRGLGDSEAPKSGYDKRSAAADVYGLVQRLGLGNVRLVGHDIGLMVSYAYAAEHPEEVSQLVLLEAPIPDESIYQFPALTPQGPGVWNFGFFNARRDFAEFLVTGRERGFLERFIRNFTFNQDAFTNADLDEYARTQRDPAKLAAGFEYFRAFDEDVEQNEKYARTKLPMPVLALGAQYSLGDSVVNQVRDYAENVRGA